MSLLKSFIRKTIYGLKRKYGTEVTYYQLNSASTNYDTGEQDVEPTAYIIRKCIALPAKASREMTKNISMISADKLFAWGGVYDAAVRTFIIDGKDLPPDFEPNNSDYLGYEGYRYSIKDITIFEQHAGWLILAKTDIGSKLNRYVTENILDPVEITEEVEDGLES